MSTTTAGDTSDTSPEASPTPTSCTYDNSVDEFLKCNKERFTTTQLVGGGIAVTFLVFGLVFAILWFCRRKKTPSSERKRDIETRRKASESDSDSDDDDDEDDEHEDKKSVRKIDARPGTARKVTIEEVSEIDISDSKVIKAPPSRPARPVQSEQTLGQGLNAPSKNGMLSAPSSRVSSYAGSPTESRSIRNLYPSNPDARNTMVGPPGRSSRPPSTAATVRPSQRPLTGIQAPGISHQPTVSSGLKPQDPQIAMRSSSYVSRGSERRPSQPPSGRAHSFHPSTNTPSARVVATATPRSTSVYSATNRRPSQQEIPLPALPSGAQARIQAQGKAESQSRSNSIMSTASRATTVTRNVPDDPPGYTSSSSRETSPKMRPQPPLKSVSSHQGISRMSSAASIEEETFVDAPETIEEVRSQAKVKRDERKPKALHDSPLPYDI